MTRRKSNRQPVEPSHQPVLDDDQDESQSVRCRGHFGLRHIEEITLDTLRHICIAMRTPSECCAGAGCRFAAAHLGSDKGAMLVSSLSALMAAVKAERKRPFHFMDAGCPLVCEDELSLLAIIRFGRFGASAVLDEAATRFAGTPDAAAIAAKGQDVAALHKAFERSAVAVEPSDEHRPYHATLH